MNAKLGVIKRHELKKRWEVSYGRFDRPSGEEEWNVWIKLEDTLMDEIVHLENESFKKRSVTQKDKEALDAL